MLIVLPPRAAGSLMNYFWALRSPASYDMYMFALSAGMLAGEGLGGVLQALLAVAKVDGSREWFFSRVAVTRIADGFSRHASVRDRDRLPWVGVLRVERPALLTPGSLARAFSPIIISPLSLIVMICTTLPRCSLDVLVLRTRHLMYRTGLRVVLARASGVFRCT